MRNRFRPPLPNAVFPAAVGTRLPGASLLILSLLAAAQPAALQAQERPPYSLDQLVELVRSGVFSDDRIIELSGRSCLAFRLDQTAVSRLLTAGAKEGLVDGLKGVCRKLPATVMLDPAEVELDVGGVDTLTARALTSDSIRILGIDLDWSSDDTTVAVVSDSGAVTAIAPGQTQVRAIPSEAPEGVAGVAMVRVMALAATNDSLRADSLGVVETSGKSAGTALALGVVVPGGGELYSGNVVKGLAIMVGSAGALTAGLLISDEDLLSVERHVQDNTCDADQGTCSLTSGNEAEVEETDYLVVGAAVAGALWLYGLIDGIRAASSDRSAGEAFPESQQLSLRLAPADGIRYGTGGEVEVTLFRLIW